MDLFYSRYEDGLGVANISFYIYSIHKEIRRPCYALNLCSRLLLFGLLAYFVLSFPVVGDEDALSVDFLMMSSIKNIISMAREWPTAW